MQRRKPLTRKTGLKGHGKRRDGAADALWSALQDHPLARFGFRREERIGPFVVDLVCPNARLAILIGDGEDERWQWLEAAGWRVLTFANNEDSQRILDEIACAFELRPVR